MDVALRRRFVSANTQITGKSKGGAAAFSVTQSPADVGRRKGTRGKIEVAEREGGDELWDSSPRSGIQGL